MYLYQHLLNKRNDLVAYEIGSVQASIKVSQVIDYEIPIPPDWILEKFDEISTKITEKIFIVEEEIIVCRKLLNLTLKKLSSMNL